MQANETSSAKIAEFLLEIHAVKLNVSQPFTWTSGWKSPIYSDNRLILSHVHIRNFVKKALGELCKANFQGAEAVVGVATAGIAPGALLADELELPFGYVRSEAKKHGMGKQVEGDIPSGTRVIVVEDLVSTGKSSLQAIEALRAHGCTVVGLVSIFTYAFDAATRAFAHANVPYAYLCDYPALITKAIEMGYVDKAYLPTLNEWRSNPAAWMQTQ